MATRSITLIPGEGIGPEITEATQRILAAVGFTPEWEVFPAGQTALDEQGTLLPKELLDSLARTKIGLKGPVSTPIGKGFRSVNVQLRQHFDLYANVRPFKSTVGIQTPFQNVDLILVRENTEGLYSGLEVWDEQRQLSDTIARLSVSGCKRIVRYAFELAQRRGRKKVTVIHKANILKQAGALMLQAGLEASRDFPEIELQDMIVDNAAMQLVVKPQRFDVLVTTNLFGDILSDLCAGLVGGLGVAPGANIGTEVAVFEAVHGTAPDIAGMGIANPTALLRSALMMLQHIGLTEEATKIELALQKTLQDKDSCTGDLGGSANTLKFADNVIKNIF
jgi:isocitrate dehydrogenase (NAD+)